MVGLYALATIVRNAAEVRFLRNNLRCNPIFYLRNAFPEDAWTQKSLIGLVCVAAANWNLGTQLKATEPEHP
jgi:hypothetical protein